MIGMVTEGLTKLGQSITDSMRNAPGLLTVVILQGITLGAVAYNSNQRSKDMQEERKLFAQERQLVIEQCIIPKATTGD
jgi:hypothetical protein